MEKRQPAMMGILTVKMKTSLKDSLLMTRLDLGLTFIVFIATNSTIHACIPQLRLSSRNFSSSKKQVSIPPTNVFAAEIARIVCEELVKKECPSGKKLSNKSLEKVFTLTKI